LQSTLIGPSIAVPDLKYPLVAALAGASAVLSGTIGEHTMRPALIKEGDEGLKRIKDWEVGSNRLWVKNEI
jgi:hypothetical protein